MVLAATGVAAAALRVVGVVVFLLIGVLELPLVGVCWRLNLTWTPMAKAIDPYFLDVRRHSLPSEKEARVKFRQYYVLKEQAALTTDHTKREELQRQITKLAGELGTHYVRFVIKKARERTSDEEFLRELISAGHEGLMIAVARFNPIKYNNKFLTYAAHWIRVRLDEAVQRRRAVHLTPHIRKKYQERGEDPPETIMTPLDDVDLVSETDTEADATSHGAYALRCLERLNFSRRTRLLLIWSLGLRGAPRTVEEISFLFYMLDGSVCVPEDLEEEREWALNQFRTWLKAHPRVEEVLRLEAH